MGNTSNLNKMSCLLRKKSGYILFNSVITLSISPVRSSAQIPIQILDRTKQIVWIYFVCFQYQLIVHPDQVLRLRCL